MRIHDLNGAGVPQYTPAAQGYTLESHKETSPERIADILKQNSPLRRKLATESIQNRPQNYSLADSYSPNHPGFTPYEDRTRSGDEDTAGGMTASKITHVRILILNKNTHRSLYLQNQKSLSIRSITCIEINLTQNRD